MGSLITLGIGKMEIDWGKNNLSRDHSYLFQPDDIKQIPCYYVDFDSEEPIVEMKEGYSRKLLSVKERLDLLGYSLLSIRQLYDNSIKESEEYGFKIHLTFDEFYSILKSIDVLSVDTAKIAVNYDENGYDFGEYFRKCIFNDPNIKVNFPVDYNDINKDDGYRLLNNLDVFLENLDPYITLRILAENPNNVNLELHWDFTDVVKDGWVKREEIVHELAAKDKILIVTEGSSDSFVIKRTLVSLYPNIADFFDFVDMEENYPFTGVGNLYNFCLGLARIGIQNNVIVIFDNDTAGVEKYELSNILKKPNKFLITKLPDYSEFINFPTIGPQGKTNEDINGKAVAIECFLDFNSIKNSPLVRWTSFNKKKEQYQGELVEKDDYIRAFKKCNMVDGTYNTTKLKVLIDYLLNQWITLQNK